MAVTLSAGDLGQIVGEDFVRAAEQMDAIDGVIPRFIAAPGDIEQVAELLRLADRQNLAVVPRGSGTKLGWGSPPCRLDLILDTQRLNRLVEHSAGDLVAIAEAGMRYGAFQAAVAGSRQMLAVDSPWPAATLGGMVASNFSGPRRHRYGTMRDVLIGVTVALPDGTVARSGGKVVKNVAGYDLMKLFTGSFGTLGVIVQTIVRLHALPEAHRVVALGLKSVEAVDPALQAVMRSPLVPTAVEIRWKEGSGSLLVLFEDFGPAVEDATMRAEELLTPFGAVGLSDLSHTTPDGAAPETGLFGVPWEDGEVCLKVNTVPAALAATLKAIDTLAWTKGIEVRVSGQATATVLWVSLRNNGDTVAETLEALRAVVARNGGSVVVAAAPEELKPALDIWGPVGDALPLMRRVKEQFDPKGIVSPGRYVGGL